MGCGTSSHVVPATASETLNNGHDKVGNGTNSNNKDDHDDLPTVVLPESPVKNKPPIAFEIPIEDLDTTRKVVSSPPAHLQRLLQPPPVDLTLPDIEEKLAEAESRRQMILQQRAASAQKRSQKMMKSLHEMDKLDSEHEPMDVPETGKHAGTNSLKMPPEPLAWEDRNI